MFAQGHKLRFSLLPGVGAAVLTAAIAYPIGRAVPVLGPAVVALLLGVAVAAARPPDRRLTTGIAFSGRYVLQGAIVCLGATLSLSQVARVGGDSLPVMLGTLAVALAAAAFFGRLLGVGERLRTLVGVGTGVCGASAIAAVSGIVGATEAEIAYSISTIFVFNIAAVVLFPVLGHVLGLSQHGYGLWAGTAVNDTSSVVAAAYAFGPAAGSYAILVKLTRTTTIIPIAAALALWRGRRGAAVGTRWRRIVPWFLLWFAAASAADTAGLVGASARHVLSQLALALIAVALAAVGLSTRPGEVRTTGLRPLVLGGIVWLSVAVASLLLQRATGVW